MPLNPSLYRGAGPKSGPPQIQGDEKKRETCTATASLYYRPNT